MTMWKKYVLDVTMNPPCWCPYEEETGNIVVGLSMIQNECPGEMVGIFHQDGQEKVNEWMENNPEQVKNLKNERKIIINQ